MTETSEGASGTTPRRIAGAVAAQSSTEPPAGAANSIQAAGALEAEPTLHTAEAAGAMEAHTTASPLDVGQSAGAATAIETGPLPDVTQPARETGPLGAEPARPPAAAGSSVHTHVPAGRLLRMAAGTYRRHLRRIVGVALPLFLPLAVIESIVLQLADLDPGASWAGVLSLLALGAIGTIATVLGWEFYAGLLDRVVGEDQRGHARYSVGQVLRALSYGRLVLASLLVWMIYTIGGLFGAIPGLIAFSFFAIVGPIINTEGLTVMQAMRRSAHLVGGAFLTTLLMITLPLGIEGAITEIVDSVLHDVGLWVLIAVEGVLAVTMSPVVGVIEVTLAHELMAREPLRAR